MSIRSIVLRALLGLCLVLNGTGAAVAAVQMTTATIASNTMASDTSHPTAANDADCHDRDMHDRSIPADAGHGSAMEDSGSNSPHTSPDCCKYGACQCACAQHAQVAVVLFPAEASIGVAGIAVHALADGRPAPAPDALLRPPIA